MHAAHTLLRGTIDYAGLFPPAGLDLATTVRNFAEYRQGSHAWALGRLIIPVGQLATLESAADTLLPKRPATPWLLSVLIDADQAPDLATTFRSIGEFNCRHAAEGAGAMLADVVELKASSAETIDAALEAVPPYLRAYVEIPIDRDPADLIRSIAQRDARAKVRTGGTTEQAFPTTANLMRFIRRCEEARVAFKATAGLHHPLRAQYRLTYAPESACATMFGFMNLFLAAAFVLAGMADADAAGLLEERSPEAFRLDDSGIEWRGHRLDLDAIANARDRAIISFGSCSFTEPITDLTALDWL